MKYETFPPPGSYEHEDLSPRGEVRRTEGVMRFLTVLLCLMGFGLSPGRTRTA